MIIDCAVYRDGNRLDVDVPDHDFDALRKAADKAGGFAWVGLYEPTTTELGDVAKAFGLHKLAVEDAFVAHQRPKLDRYDDNVFLVLKTLWYVDELDAVETGEINVFVGEDFVITVRHGQGSELHATRSMLERSTKHLTHGPAAVVYAVCDTVVDSYLEVLSALQDDVDEVEESVFSVKRTRDSARIYTLRREIAEVRRAVLPLREPMRQLAAGEVPCIDKAAAPFFRDVVDHLAQAAESVDSLDQLLASAFDAHLASISVQQNDDMRKISAGAAIVVVPTLIAGIYGMNFKHMPELEWALGYPYALLLMVASAGLLIWFFKRSGWL
ncbi:magnesium/cobalt transporter CorA [Nocardioides sp. GXZ039]|uniref:magnesium/cobalt transporter CorA n=1 Tax=Nocardioides sp. GXZ039 TaxID=3136018 RepID=UPI0030F38A2E